MDATSSSLAPEYATIAAAAGHAARSGEGLRVQPRAGGSQVLKPLDPAELAIYERLGNAHADPATSAVPRFFGVAEVDTAKFLQLENLTHGAPKAVVMDVKLGRRTFQECELLSTKPRPDLFEKALKLFPDRLDEPENRSRSMTKARFMTLRDASTTIGSLGYRIDGVSNYSEAEQTHAEAGVASAINAAHTKELFIGFAKAASSESASALSVAQRIVGQLSELREKLEESEFVASHEFVGSSLLFVAGSEPRVAWIDFAKSTPLPAGSKVTHRAEWTCGNHEDGLLFGLDNLLAAWQQVVDRLSELNASELGLELCLNSIDTRDIVPKSPQGDDLALLALRPLRASSSAGTCAKARPCRRCDTHGTNSWPVTKLNRQFGSPSS